MSKEIDKIYHALENMSITFDELGFAPTIPIPKGDKAHFVDWFSFEIEMIKAASQQQDQRIAELEEQLKNAIVPKFKIGQIVWFIDTRVNDFNENKYVLTSSKIETIKVDNFDICYEDYWGDVMTESDLFATKEEAQAKLEELKGE